jgi:DegV family protein with EDD domain
VEHNIKLFTDSAADLPRHIQEAYDVDIVPLSVIFGEQEYKDGVTISPEEFYRKLASDPELPSTNQVNPHEFVQAFRPYLDAGKDILYIGLSHRLSGTFQSAVLAKEMLDSKRVHLFNSLSASLGEALCVLKAGELAAAGLSIPEIVFELEKHRRNAFGFFMLDALDHVVRGGRLSKTQGLVGSILQIKPLLHFTPEGTIEVRERVRTAKKALQSMIDKALTEQTDFSNATLAAAHTNAGSVFQEFVAMVKEQLKPKRLIEGLVGSTVGTHAGPGGIGLFY